MLEIVLCDCGKIKNPVKPFFSLVQSSFKFLRVRRKQCLQFNRTLLVPAASMPQSPSSSAIPFSSHHLRASWPTTVHLTFLCSPWSESTLLFRLEIFLVNNQECLIQQKACGDGGCWGFSCNAREDSWLQEGRLEEWECLLKQNCRRVLTLHTLLSFTKLYKYCQEVYFGSFLKRGMSF